MKIILVSPESSDSEKLRSFLKLSGRNDVLLFHYYHPLKAIDNLEELRPDLIVWSIIDFPRHWKTLIPFADGIPGMENLRMVLYANRSIEEKEIDKAHTLKVAGIIQQGLSSPEGQDVLTEALANFPAEDNGQSGKDSAGAFRPQGDAEAKPSLSNMRESLELLRLEPMEDRPISLIMSHPLNLKIIRGEVLAIDPDSIEFSPAKDRDLADLPSGTIIKGSRLKIGEHSLRLDVKLQKMTDRYGLVIQEPEKEYIPVISNLLHGKIG